jgi:hypothetical protein
MTQKSKHARIAVEYFRSNGQRNLHGAVTLQFAPAETYHFRSSASWPEAADYTSTVERAVRGVLLERGVIDKLSCTLTHVGWDKADSCEDGFALAARAAARALFDD